MSSRSLDYQSKLMQLVKQDIIPDIESGNLVANVDKIFDWPISLRPIVTWKATRI